MGDGRKKLWEAYRWSNIDFSPKEGRVKSTKKGSTSTNNHPSMFWWCHFWDSDKCNHYQASVRSFSIIKLRSWQRAKGTSTKAMWWLWKVTYAWIKEYFNILCKSIGHTQPNEEIWEEDGRDMCSREDPMFTVKEVSLCGGRDWRVVKYGCSFNPRSYGKITSPWGKNQWDSKWCECISTFFKERWFWIFLKG
jgi:hypothetical protein